ncbi:MAG: Co2+/Mg2+ efflux protein ApaG [Casimicrobiaceae bacterium]|nr:Co2+/Mg2+ efflux protein ApaG [Casimicrobiaceae bacterium]MCX8098293.1 Co2+/Mg2+ efflux protein ApaG [Casimicrobiaceae bacterium]MDW8311770.1 Co2+/Mg2+ efflux protein ApaG [Burkholderiales bacterium]
MAKSSSDPPPSTPPEREEQLRSPRGARISVAIDPTPFYLPEQSDPAQNLYTFAYHIVIVNTGEVTVKLLSRHWIITDGDGKVEHVRGEGVVGQQPVLAPGERFSYTSGSRFRTPVGTMEGSYRFVTEDGTVFDAAIPRFTLSVQRTLH